MESYSLFELNEYIRRVIALNFEEPIWVHCEISQIKQSGGQHYLDLVEKHADSQQVIAQAPAVMWRNTFWFLRKKIGDTLFDILRDGVAVRLKVRVDFHERYGLKLNITDLDPSFTLGSLEMQRREILERLRKEKLLEKNAQLPLPRVLQHIAVLSSEKAAGLQDFLKHLQDNPYGYAIAHTLYPIPVQGSRVEVALVNALQEIAREDAGFDCIVIVRGGGSKLDLSGFDSYQIGKSIALAQIPVLTGIGHEIDQTITDIVAHTAFKTPTATADFIIEHNGAFEASLLECEQILQNLGRQSFHRANVELEQMAQLFHILPGHVLEGKQNALSLLVHHLESAYRGRIALAHHTLESLEGKTEVLDPLQTVRRGFSITRHKGKILKDPAQVREGDLLETELAEGHVFSISTTPES